MDSKQPARALCYPCPKGHVVMLQLPALPVEVGLLLSLLVQEAIVFECLQLNTEKGSLVFGTSKSQIKLLRDKMQAGKGMSPAISIVQYHHHPWGCFRKSSL